MTDTRRAAQTAARAYLTRRPRSFSGSSSAPRERGHQASSARGVGDRCMTMCWMRGNQGAREQVYLHHPNQRGHAGCPAAMPRVGPPCSRPDTPSAVVWRYAPSNLMASGLARAHALAPAFFRRVLPTALRRAMNPALPTGIWNANGRPTWIVHSVHSGLCPVVWCNSGWVTTMSCMAGLVRVPRRAR